MQMLHWLARSEVGEPLKANPTEQDGLEPESPIVRIKKSPDVMSGHIWGERSGSNRRQPVPQTGALPTELRSPSILASFTYKKYQSQAEKRAIF